MSAEQSSKQDIRKLYKAALKEMHLDADYWEQVASGQDSEEAEYSGYLEGYASGLKTALDLLERER